MVFLENLIDNCIFSVAVTRNDVNSKPHRAHSARATHASFSRVHVAQDVWVVLCLVFLEKSFHLIHVSWHFAWYTFLLTKLSHFRHLHPIRWLILRFSILRRIQPLSSGLVNALWQVRSPKTLIEVSSEHTPVNLPSRKDGRDHGGCVWNEWRERSGTIDFTSVFLGARSKWQRIQCFWFSQGTHAQPKFVLKKWETSAGRRAPRWVHQHSMVNSWISLTAGWDV